MSGQSQSSTIPTSFTERYIWKPEPTVESTSTIWSFEGDMLSDIQWGISYAFQCASDATTGIGKTVTLLSPYHSGNAVLDAVLRVIAHEQNADILVLDSLELVAGPFGALGKDGSLVDAIYSRLPIEQFTDVEDIHQFFLALLSAGLESPSADSSPPRRIIYMRDFGLIARAAPPLLIFIFRAIENLRTTHKSNMIVVFGSSRPLGRFACPDSSAVVRGFYTFKWKFEDSGISSNARRALKTNDKPSFLVPILKNKTFYSHDIPFKRRTLASDFFAPIFCEEHRLGKDLLSFAKKAESPGSNSNLDTAPTTTNDDGLMCWQNRVTSFSLSDLCFSVYPKDIRLTDQQSVLDDRASQLSGIILKLILAQKGINVEGPCNLSENLLECEREDNELKYSIIDPATVDHILETLSIIINIGQTAGPLSIATGNQVVEALSLWLKRRKRLENWIERENMRVARIVKTDDVKSPKALIEQVRKAEDLSEEEEELLSCIVDTEPLSTSFQDVCINKKIIENLRSIVSLPLLYPHHYKSGILSRETLPGALLYGPPGTGKTMVCRALACESGARMLLIKPSDVYRKWLGESEQLANAIFKLAHRLAPCIVFIDEVDAILGARKSGNRSWHSTMLTEFMQAIDGMNSGTNSKDKGVVVVGATNRPFDLDQAILRRLPYRMLIDLPGLLERESILKAHLKGENLVDIDFANVAADTEGYSGSDLKNLCVSAALEALKDCIGGFELPLINPQGDENKESSPNNPPQAPQDANGQAKVTNSERAITMEHIKRGFKQVAASFSFEGNRQLYAWHKVYGTVGN